MWNLDADYPCPIKRAALYNEMLIVGRMRLPPCLFEIAVSGLFWHSIRMSLSSNDESWLHSSARIALSIGIYQYGGHCMTRSIMSRSLPCVRSGCVL